MGRSVLRRDCLVQNRGHGMAETQTGLLRNESSALVVLVTPLFVHCFRSLSTYSSPEKVPLVAANSILAATTFVGFFRKIQEQLTFHQSHSQMIHGASPDSLQ